MATQGTIKLRKHYLLFEQWTGALASQVLCKLPALQEENMRKQRSYVWPNGLCSIQCSSVMRQLPIRGIERTVKAYIPLHSCDQVDDNHNYDSIPAATSDPFAKRRSG